MAEQRLVTLIVTGLADLRGALNDQAVLSGDFPSLKLLLARGQAVTGIAADYHAILAEQLQLPLPMPVAAFTRLIDRPEDTQTDETLWLRADPVVIRPDLVKAYLVQNKIDQPGAPPDGELYKNLKDLFSEYGLQFDWPLYQRAYLRLQQPLDFNWVDPQNALGRDLAEVLPSSSSAGRWKSLLNEVQMIFHAYNAEAGAGQMPAANSLWFWGNSEYPLTELPAVQSGSLVLISHDVLWRGIAQHFNLPIVETLEQAPPNHSVLLHYKVDYQRTPQNNLVALDQLLSRLLQRLRNDSQALLRVIGDHGASWSLNRSQLKYFWRRRKPLNDLFNA